MIFKRHKAKHYNGKIKVNTSIKLLILFIIPAIIMLNASDGILSYFTTNSFLNNHFMLAGTYTVEFDANTGTGTMPDQKMFCGRQENLNNNTFTKTDYFFSGWNTSADGSGTNYTNTAEVQDLANKNSTITLYAQWTSADNTHTVTFIANDGTSSEEIRYVPNNTPVGTLSVLTRQDYEFLGWYTSLTGGTKISENEIITKDEIYYARWNRFHYEKQGSTVFDGTNYIDTDIKLFSEENISKNFEISFEISDIEANQKNQATIVNSMEEVNPYPGFVFRIQTNGTQVEFNAPKIANKTNINMTSLNKVVLKRINDIYYMYMQINDGAVQQIGTYSYGRTFDIPVVLGSSLDVNPPRYFKGTLSNINIDLWESEYYTVIFDSNGGTGTMPNQEIRLDETKNLSANIFEREDWIFNGWNTEPDGSGTKYIDGKSVKNLTTVENDIVDLYANWTVKSYSESQYVFDGTNYIDTGVYLFEEGTITRDFEISFEIVNQEATQNTQATLISAMDETASPWPGIVYRFKSGSNTEHQIGVNVNGSKKAEKNLGSNVTKVDIKRTDGVIYLKINDGSFEEILDMSTLDKTFHVPLTFGTSLKSNGTPQRQFKGTLSNLYVEIF